MLGPFLGYFRKDLFLISWQNHFVVRKGWSRAAVATPGPCQRSASIVCWKAQTRVERWICLLRCSDLVGYAFFTLVDLFCLVFPMKPNTLQHEYQYLRFKRGLQRPGL